MYVSKTVGACRFCNIATWFHGSVYEVQLLFATHIKGSRIISRLHTLSNTSQRYSLAYNLKQDSISINQFLRFSTMHLADSTSSTLYGLLNHSFSFIPTQANQLYPRHWFTTTPAEFLSLIGTQHFAFPEALNKGVGRAVPYAWAQLAAPAETIEGSIWYLNNVRNMSVLTFKWTSLEI